MAITTNAKIKGILDNYLTTEASNNQEILERLRHIISEVESHKHDDYFLHKQIPEHAYLALIDHYDGSAIRLPSKKEYRDLLILVLAFYMREIQGRDWEDIKQVLNVNDQKLISGITLGKKISMVRERMTEKLQTLFQTIDTEALLAILKKVGHNV